MFVLLYFFFWPLCCLFFFDIPILITPLACSTLFIKRRIGTHIYHIPKCKLCLWICSWHCNIWYILPLWPCCETYVLFPYCCKRRYIHRNQTRILRIYRFHFVQAIGSVFYMGCTFSTWDSVILNQKLIVTSLVMHLDLGVWCLTPRLAILQLYRSFLDVGNRSARGKPSTCRK